MVLSRQIRFSFVEEASQISVADLVALGGITKNIILVGDSAQLGQPLQGAHPGNLVVQYWIICYRVKIQYQMKEEYF